MKEAPADREQIEMAKGGSKATRAFTTSSHGKVSLLKRGKWYYARFRDAGRRHEVALELTNKVTAERKASELDKALQKGEPWEWVLGRTAAGDRTFQAVVDEWLEKGCSWSQNTRRGHAAIVRQLKDTFGDRPVTRIRSADIEAYLAQRRDGGMPAASRNRILATLKSVFKKVGPPPEGWGYVPTNPAAAIRMEKEDVKTKDILDDHEFELLLGELPESDRRCVLCAAETAMRRSELQRLMWEDVDLPAKELRVTESKNRTFRIVPLTERLREVLTNMKAAVKPHAKDSVFAIVTDNRTIKAALTRAKIDKVVTLHTFRHQLATRALEAGVSSFHLQAIGGWKSPVMLERYGRRRNSALHEQMAKLDRTPVDGALIIDKSRSRRLAEDPPSA